MGSRGCQTIIENKNQRDDCKFTTKQFKNSQFWQFNNLAIQQFSNFSIFTNVAIKDGSKC
jgi:hypothetical protein